MTPDVYLASSSPRRKELLAQIGVRFVVIHPCVDERRLADEPPEGYVARLAMDKARTGLRMVLDGTSLVRKPVIGADTCIAIGDDLIGKPTDRQHYLALMARLSGNTHQVYTAVAVAGYAGTLDHPSPDHLENKTTKTKERCLISCTSVQFREISVQEREWYWQTGEPRDKAGGYAIQGLAATFVQSIHGSYSGVVGLPLFETAQLLIDFGMNPLHNLGQNAAQE